MRGLRHWLGGLKWVAYFRRQQRWVALLASTIVALLLWLLSALNDTYTKRVHLPLAEGIKLPVNYAVVDSSRIPKVVAVDITASGSTLFRYSLQTLFKQKSKLWLEVDSSYLDPNGGYWTLRDFMLREDVLSIMPLLSQYMASASSNIELKIYPEEISFGYAPLSSQVVPVVFSSQVDFGKNENYLLTSYYMKPEMVQLYGVKKEVDRFLAEKQILQTDTLPLIISEPGRSEHRVPVRVPSGMKVEPREVTVTLEVEELRYYSEVIHLNNIENAPYGYNVRLFPSTVEVRYLAPKDTLDANNKPGSLQLYVDAKGIGGDVKYLDVKLREYPRYAYTLQIEPDRVEYLLEEQE